MIPRRLAFLAMLAILLALPAFAGDPDFYHRTGTKPPARGEWLLGFGANYTDKMGAGGMLGYHFKGPGITLLGSISAVELKGENGSTEFRRFCQTYDVPFSTGNRTQAEFAVNVLFTLKKATR